MLQNDDYDVICVTESWLKDDIPNSLLDPNHNYNILRTDRRVARGGGVCVFIKTDLDYVGINDNKQSEIIELALFDLVFEQFYYRFAVIYRKTIQGDTAIQAAKQLTDTLEKYRNTRGPMFITGDLNCPGIDWNNSCLSDNANVDNIIHSYVVHNGFVQFITEPTRGKNILDVVLTDQPVLVRDACVGPAFSNSDHESIMFTIDTPPSESDENTDVPSGAKRYNWSKADFNTMSDLLNAVQWNELFTTNFTADDIWKAFCNILDEVIDMSVPSFQVRIKTRRAITRYPRPIQNLFKCKLAMWKVWKANRGNTALKQQYNQVKAECRRAVREHEIKKENEVIQSNDVGKLYRFVNKKTSCRSGIGSLRTATAGKYATTDTEKANLLNEYFSSVCTEDNGIIPPFNVNLPAGIALDTVSFDVPKLIKAIKKIKNKNKLSCGPDGYPVKLLTSVAPALLTPLSMMYNSFMSVGMMPAAWRTATVTPVYKKGPSSNPENYRPISQTSVFCKLLERVIVADIVEYLLKNKLLNHQQHGFLANRSTLTNLLESTFDWTLAVDNRRVEAVIYVDFSKAFDSVCHSKLIAKLAAYGVTGNLLSLIAEFLSNRSQWTTVGNSISGRVNLSSGTVQGSCLGPLLFLVYINDIFTIFDEPITSMLYADDLKLYTIIDSTHDIDQMQNCLDNLSSWAEAWQLTISIRKCQSICIGSQPMLRNAPIAAIFSINKEILPNVASVVDLGVTIDSNLKFSVHIGKITCKAFARSSLILKCFVSRDSATLIKAFTTYVRPLLEYNSSVWSPFLLKDINLLESVQRRFTKRLPCMHNVSYDERLSMLGLERLEARRLRTDIVTTYKILFGLTEINSYDFFTFSQTSIVTRGHQYKLLPPSCHCDARKYFFNGRVVQNWNDLNPYLTDFSCLQNFKTSLKHFNFRNSCIGKQ